MSPWRRLLPYVVRLRASFVLGVLCVVVTTGFGVAGPWVLKLAVDDLLAGVTTDKLRFYAASVLGLALAGGVFRFAMRRLMIGASRQIEYAIRNDFYAALQRQHLAYFHQRKTGDLMSRATSDLNAVRMMIGPAVMYISSTALTFVVTLGLMVSLNPRLTALALLPLPGVTLVVYYCGLAIHRRFEAIQEQLASVSAVVQESLSGVRVVRAYAQEPFELERFRRANEEYVRRNRALVRLEGMYFPSMGLLMGVSTVVVLWVGSGDVMGGRMSIGELVAFNAYLMMLSWPLIAFGWVTNLLQRGLASWARVLEVLDAEPAITDEEATAEISSAGAVAGEITLRGLTFAYDGDPVLRDLSVTMPAGKTTAIVGATGSGKSTLLSLLPRLHQPPAGTVFIDGVDVRHIPLRVLRAAIGFVPQEPFLFSATLAENVALGVDRDAWSTARLEAAATAACLDQDLPDLPKGYETVVGERGITLSGGQKQRTAIARAVAVDPRILVLDDAFSAVDTQTEDRILTRLASVTAGRTTLLVSHRISTVKHAHQILVLAEGRLVERGTHEELVAREGVYADLHRKQLLEEELAGVVTHDDEVLGKAYDARLMRRLLGYVRPYHRSVGFAIAAIIGHSLLELVPPYLTKVVIDTSIPARDTSGVAVLAVTYLACLVASFALEDLQTWTMQMTGQRIMFDLRMQLYGHLQRLDVAFYDKHPVGRLMTRVTTDVDALNDLFTSGVVSIFGDAFTLVGIMAVLVWMDWRLALVAFSVLPLIGFVAQWFRRNVRASYRNVRTLVARINAFLQEHITGASTSQLFRREAADYTAFDEIDSRYRDANVQSIVYYAVFYPAIELVSALATALLIWIGGGWVLDDALTMGSLVAFVQYAQRFFRPISDMSEKFNVLQGAMASSERIFMLLDTPVQIAPDLMTPAALAQVEAHGPGHIRFEHVTFAYTPGQPVLDDVSFEIRPGQRVGLVGATGSGKTTVVSLLLRFYEVQSGRITVDGVDIRQMDVRALRAKFGLVLQDVHLFSGTIAENVRLGRTDLSDDAVRAALQAVHADAFVARLPGDIQAAVVERGATLSVGQKQLLSFARALAFDPQVLILDEATSSVDTDTERLIQDALSRLMRGRTTLAIAHRLSTIQDMDQILVMHRGRLRESGTHQQLLAARGLYRRLYELQFA